MGGVIWENSSKNNSEFHTSHLTLPTSRYKELFDFYMKYKKYHSEVLQKKQTCYKITVLKIVIKFKK